MEEIRKVVREIVEKELNNLDYNYVFDNSRLQPLIDNARKYKEKDFIEDYVDLNDISVIKDPSEKIELGDQVIIGRKVRSRDGKQLYKNSLQVYAPYKTVVADKYYGSNFWTFILDNTKELQDEAKKLYHDNKNNKKTDFSNKIKTITGYHASPNKFNQFKQGESNSSHQLGADSGFFFFKDRKYAEKYASALKENNDKVYIYECSIKAENVITEKGENVGTNWNRVGWLQSAEAEGFDVAIIEDADTGYGITDEIIVFDDDNIKIEKVVEV